MLPRQFSAREMPRDKVLWRGQQFVPAQQFVSAKQFVSATRCMKFLWSNCVRHKAGIKMSSTVEFSVSHCVHCSCKPSPLLHRNKPISAWCALRLHTVPAMANVYYVYPTKGQLVPAPRTKQAWTDLNYLSSLYKYRSSKKSTSQKTPWNVFFFTLYLHDEISNR